MTKEAEKLLVTAAEEGMRLDGAVRLLVEEDISRAAIQRWIEEGAILLNGMPAAKSSRVQSGDQIELVRPDPIELSAKPENIALDIVYEDSDLLVVNKPKGMVVHPAPGNPTGTLVNALLYHCKDQLSGIGGVLRPGIVHRIDKDTSGLLIVAKNDRSHRALAQQIAGHHFLREYRTVVYGNLREEEGTVDAPIGRHPVDRKKMAVTDKNSKRAVTHYQVLGRFPGFCYLCCRLETGRTHQIRVHMAYLGHPVAGDPVYGPKKVIMQLQGQCLHAKCLGFVHPTTGQYLEFDSELPEYFTEFLKKHGG